MNPADAKVRAEELLETRAAPDRLQRLGSHTNFLVGRVNGSDWPGHYRSIQMFWFLMNRCRRWTSAVQAGIIELLDGRRQRLNVAIVFVANDLSVIRHVSDMVR